MSDSSRWKGLVIGVALRHDSGHRNTIQLDTEVVYTVHTYISSLLTLLLVKSVGHSSVLCSTLCSKYMSLQRLFDLVEMLQMPYWPLTDEFCLQMSTDKELRVGVRMGQKGHNAVVKLCKSKVGFFLPNQRSLRQCRS